MKRIIIISLVALFISFTASAQENRKAKVFQMSMFANIGTKTLNFKNLENIPMPKVGYNLGAGAYWSYKSILFSSDFYYSQASEENSVNKTNYNAFANTLYLGYKVIDNYYITLAPLAGIAITNNKISVYGGIKYCYSACQQGAGDKLEHKADDILYPGAAPYILVGPG